jgi:hypothetical protein
MAEPTSIALFGETTRNVGFVAPLSKAVQFSEGLTRHHRPFYDDYEVAKAHILQALGDISETDIFGRNVLVGVFCRPNRTPNGVYLPVTEMREDWWQHKVVLVLLKGPEAFEGADSWLKAKFPGEPPKPGDWLFAPANAGIQINLHGDGGTRPQGIDHRGEVMDMFQWDGWPCRIIPDDQFLGRLTKPHSVI